MNAPIVKKSILDDGSVLSGTSISILFKDVGEISLNSEETDFALSIGTVAHALISDDRTQKTGHVFLFRTQGADLGQSINDLQSLGAGDMDGLDHNFVYEVLGRPDENLSLTDVHALAGANGGVVAYADSVAIQLMVTAQHVSVNEKAKTNILIELDETLAMKELG